MQRRLDNLRRQLAALSVGGAALGVLGLDNCAQNSDVRTLFQTSGDAVISAVSDAALNDSEDGSNYDSIVRQPLTTFVQALWNNYVYLNLPQDPSSVAVVEK